MLCPVVSASILKTIWVVCFFFSVYVLIGFSVLLRLVHDQAILKCSQELYVVPECQNMICFMQEVSVR